MQTLLRIVGTRYYCPKCDVKRGAIIQINWKNGTPKILFCTNCAAEHKKAA